MDIWIAPTNENKKNSLDTIHGMGYSVSEIESIKNEDFTLPFICSLGTLPHVIDILTFVHEKISFDEAEKSMIIFKLSSEIDLYMAPYEFLKDIKLRSGRPKDLWDVARLEELRNNR
ncbi:MAG: hypothetical protein ABIT96_07645 [Ferruginibacter sp.]